MKSILISNFKGGVGKTLSTAIFAEILAVKGKRVLVIDFDSQMNCTQLLTRKAGEEIKTQLKSKNIFKAIQEDNLGENAVNTGTNNLDIVAGHENINLFENLIDEKGVTKNRYLYFRFLIEQLRKREDYDIVLFDTSPSKSSLILSVIAACDFNIVLTQSETMSISMVDSYLKDIRKIGEVSPYTSEILGIVVSMKDNSNQSKKLLEEMQSKYGGFLFSTKIKRKSHLNRYATNGFPNRKKDGEFYSGDRTALNEYLLLHDEIMHRILLIENKKSGVK